MTAITPGTPTSSPWSKNKPGVVDTNRQDILVPDEVWSGQLVRANVVPFAWTHTGRKGVSFGLNHLQIIQSEGRQRLDGRPVCLFRVRRRRGQGKRGNAF